MKFSTALQCSWANSLCTYGIWVSPMWSSLPVRSPRVGAHNKEHHPHSLYCRQSSWQAWWHRGLVGSVRWTKIVFHHPTEQSARACCAHGVITCLYRESPFSGGPMGEKKMLPYAVIRALAMSWVSSEGKSVYTSWGISTALELQLSGPTVHFKTLYSSCVFLPCVIRAGSGMWFEYCVVNGHNFSLL